MLTNTHDMNDHTMMKITNDWENPLITGINKEDGRSFVCNFKSIKNALDNVGTFECKPYDPLNPIADFISLNGEWSFKLYYGLKQVYPVDFYSCTYDITNWKQIAVPGCWQTQGYDIPIYTNIKYPFPVDPPNVPSNNPIGCYRRSFSLPSSFLNKIDSRYILRFDGVDSAFHVWINGNCVGFSKDSRLPAEFDITNYINQDEKENIVALRVYRWSDGTYLEDQDMWFLSGIQRDVYILRVDAASSIFDFHWKSYLNDYLLGISNKAKLDINVCLRSFMSNNKTIKCEVRLYDASKTLLIKKECNATHELWKDNLASSFKEQIISLSLYLENPLLWSAEIPHLYTLIVLLKDENDKPQQVESSYVGFRQVEINNGQLLINKQYIYIYGVNHHEFHPKGGKTVPKSRMEEEMKLLKQFNFNAVRMSHYPQHSYFYTLCSKYGLYVIDEANIETHGFAPCTNQLANDKNWKDAFLERGRRMYLRDRNHVCIISWSLGNESGYGQHHDDMARYFRSVDSSRFIHYEPACMSSSTPEKVTDVLCPMYPRIEMMKDMIKKHPLMPMILCEYSHAMGNSNGNLFKYWEMIRQHKQCQGGFIWDFMDQGLELKAKDSDTLFWGYGGDTGDETTPHDGNFNCNGLVLPDLTPHPAIYECKKLFQNFTFSIESITGSQEASDKKINVGIVIYNRSSFLSTNNLVVRFTLKENGSHVRTYEKKCVLIDPEKNKTMEIYFHEIKNASWVKERDRLTLYVSLHLDAATIWGRKGHEIAWEQFDLTDSLIHCFLDDTLYSPYHSLGDSLRLEMVENGNEFIVHGKNFEARFSSSTCGLYSLKYEEHEMLYHGKDKDKKNIFQPQFFRALTDNDRGGCDGAYYKLWRLFGFHKPCIGPCNSSLEYKKNDHNCLQIISKFEMHPVPELDPFKEELDVNAMEVQDPSTLGDHTGCIVSLLVQFLENETMEVLNMPHNFGWFTRMIVHQYADALGLQHTDCSKIMEDQTNVTFVEIRKSNKISAQEVMKKRVFQCCVNYQIFPSGDILFNVKIDPYARWPCIPRVGVRFLLPETTNSIIWSGRGPHENYPDRKEGTFDSIHSATNEDMFFPYIRPSETGNRTDVRWLALHSSKPDVPGIFISSLPLQVEGMKSDETETMLNFSALKYTPTDIDEADHVYQLPETDYTCVNIDNAIMGLGGDDSWTPSVHKEYLVQPRNFEFQFMLGPLHSSDLQDPHSCYVKQKELHSSSQSKF